MTSFLQLFVGAIIPMALLDMAWLRLTVETFYRSRIGHLLADSFSLTPGIVFYVIYIFALTFLVLHPAFVSNTPLSSVIFRGAVFGMATYATYDLTSQAVLKAWPTSVSVVDIIWGTLLTAIVSGLSFYIVQLLA